MRDEAVGAKYWVSRVGVAIGACLCGVVSALAEPAIHARLDRLERIYEVRSDLTFVETTDIDYTLVTPRGLRLFDRFAKTYAPDTQSLEVLEAWVDQPDGTRVQVGPEGRFTRPSVAAQNAPGFSSSMTTTLLYPQLRPGSRTHVRWRLTQTAPPFLGFNAWIQPPLETSVGLARIIVKLPTGVTAQWRTRGFIVTDLPSQRGRIIEARLTATTAEEPERDMVATADFQPLFLVTTLPGPQALGALYWDASLTRSAVTPEIAALAQRLAGGRDGEAASRAVYDWVTRNIRYVAVYLDANDSWVPHAAADVLRAGYGDCKDHVVLMQALLGALGIRAQAGLVDWGGRTRDPPLWLPQAFNHAIVYLPDYDRFLNPTDPYARFDALNQGLAGKAVVIASPDGRLARTPVARPEDNAYALDQSLTLDADGTLHGSARVRMSPNVEGGIRAMVARASSTQELAGRLLAMTPEGGFGEFRTSDPLDLDQDFDVVGTWRSPHAVAFQSGIATMQVPVGLDLDAPARLRRYLTAEPRRHAVTVGVAEESRTTRIALPPGVSVARLPDDITLRNDAGLYTATYRRIEHGIRVERHLTISRAVFEPAEADDLEALLYAPINDARATLTLSRAQAEAANPFAP